MSIKILHGDCREVLHTLPDESVHCVVTSPPYWGLRDYGTATWEGGDAGCDHKEKTARNDGGRANVGSFNGSAKPDSDKGAMNFRDLCGHCGARRIDSQLGLEPTYQEYVANMVEVFREVRRVLRKDGTLWLNLGDSYAQSEVRHRNKESASSGLQTSAGAWSAAVAQTGRKLDHGSLKPKDLCGIPWRVAFALQADGWYLRQDIIWSKPNPMPESVRDRCTKAHEYIFLLSKSDRYYYDADAIAEPAIGAGRILDYTGEQKANTADPDLQRTLPRGRKITVASMRNRRSVWEIASQAFPESHFATFPPALIEPCIMAGCPKGGTVLDPFGGAGTTGLVADRLGRNAILIELNPEYAQMAERRLKDDAGMFAEVF